MFTQEIPLLDIVKHLARLPYLPLLCSLFLLSTLSACAPQSKQDEAPAQRYEARGIVRQLADPPAQELYIQHEEIPSFINIDGEVVGMGSMAMPFPVSETPLPADLKAGDKVSFEFEVSWYGSPPMRLLSLQRLEPNTILSFETESASDTPSHEAGPGDHGNHEDHSMSQEIPENPES